ncbi:MAG: heme lyase CcmF/NrfE family subunit [Proteobacteria bacterium]|nr:heme lyase CcmF/NrfE family subunit [Pseudomonadota bacterium]
MIAEIGHFALILGLVLALVQALVPWWGLRANNPLLVRLTERVAIAQFGFIFFSFLVLTYLFVVSDFSVAVVMQNSHTTKPLMYKIAGVWGNHEGSMLLWVLILALFGAFLARRGSKMRAGLRIRALGIQGMIGFAFILFLVFTSNPFARIFPAPLDGLGLNPLLQDPGLVFHPPFLYLGYVGLSTAFSLAAAGLLEGKIDRIWARHIRPWVLSAWCFLTFGIGLGSWWAYHELGWGGWWFWDPVENASFMPWLFATALFHSLRVVEKREALKSWTVLLAILAFSFSLIGTFLVRSGILTSVHAFAVDPTRGVFLLVLLTLAIGGALALFGYRAPKLKPLGSFSPVSRESGIMINNLFIISACLTVFLGTFYPLFVDALTGNKISVGAPYFNITFLPIMIPALVLLGAAIRLPWKKGSLKQVLYELRFALISALVIGALVAWFFWADSVVAIGGVVLAAWIAGGTLTDLAKRIRLKGSPIKDILSRAIRLPGAFLGMAIAHLGVAVIVLAITGVSFWRVETIGMMDIGDQLHAGNLTLRLDKAFLGSEENYDLLQGDFTILDGAEVAATVVVQKRYYPVRGMETTEAGIHSTFWGDYYVTMGPQAEDGKLAVHFFRNPLMPWMWFGAILLVIGGMVAMIGGHKPSSKAKESKAS